MQDPAADHRPVPLINPVSEPFFAAAREDRLVLQHCPRDGFFFYPRERCPKCLGADWSWREASPLGTLYSFTVDRMGQDPSQRSRVPFHIALVDLDDGPRMVGGLVLKAGTAPAVGQRVRVRFERVGGEPVICFEPCPKADSDGSVTSG